jgi:hypothetical protein
MASDFKSKKIPAPEQPIGLSISAYRIAHYTNQMVSNNDLRGYKRLFEQIKILVKSIMHVLCETKLTIDLSLWGQINSIRIPPGTKDTVITFPVQKYDYTQWVIIFRSLIPSVPYPFNAKVIRKSLTNSQSIELISRDSSNASSIDALNDYSDDSDNETEQCVIEECHEDWYETAVYAYQNLLLTSSSKKRELIDADFQEANSKARNRIERNKAHEARTKAINDLKKSTYDWVNRMGHIVRHHKYIRLNSIPERLKDIQTYMQYFSLQLINGVLNNSFNETGIIDDDMDYILDSQHKYPKEVYFDQIRLYRSKKCISDRPTDERTIYDTIANLIMVFYDHHYNRPVDDLLHEFNIQTVVMSYLDGVVPTQRIQIRSTINRLTDKTFDEIRDNLLLFDHDIVRNMLADNVHGEPQQQYTVRMMAEFDIGERAIVELRNHRAKKFESYHNTVAWGLLYNVVPFSITSDETIFEPKIALDIYIALLNNTKINPQLIKDNKDQIMATIDELMKTASGYAKYRLEDALVVANNILINI